MKDYTYNAFFYAAAAAELAHDLIRQHAEDWCKRAPEAQARQDRAHAAILAAKGIQPLPDYPKTEAEQREEDESDIHNAEWLAAMVLRFMDAISSCMEVTDDLLREPGLKATYAEEILERRVDLEFCRADVLEITQTYVMGAQFTDEDKEELSRPLIPLQATANAKPGEALQ